MTVPQTVVLLAVSGESTRIVYQRLALQFDVVRVVLEERISRAHLLRRRAKKVGKRAAVSQAAFAALMVPALRVGSRARLDELRARLGASPEIPETVITRVQSANDETCIALLRSIGPAVVVVNGSRILSKRILETVPAVFLNMHAGITPRYRGVHGAYWALAEGRPRSTGITVHRVDTGIDTGRIIGQARIEVGQDDTFVTLPLLQLICGLPILTSAVRAALDGALSETTSLDASTSRLHFHPGFFEYLRTWAKTGVR